uniref:Vacuolar protein sorting-associated protein 13 n=1 Tax=Strigamia maritima TaxID=126957 RepID=T1J4H6_STRMM
MVFESIVTDLLNKFLGSYVQNLDSSQLKIGIWGGDVVLQNLILKENALNELDLPVKTTYGSLGKLVLKIPWKNLYNAPVVASIENLQLLVVPNTDVKYNDEKEEKIAWDTKQQLIKKLEEAKRIEEERKKPRDPQQDTFTEKLVTQVIKNLQINIKDIHVRYEDKLSHAGNPFAFGITLHTLTFESTDDKWKVGIVQDANVKMIYKLVTMSNCAFYWNSKTKLFSEMNEGERSLAFMNGISTESFHPANINAVLGPINSTLKLQINPKPEQSNPEFSIPKLVLSLIMDDLSFSLSKFQYHDILILSQSLEWMTISSRYRKYKPDVPVKGHAKQWWHFAYKCILEEDVRRRAKNWSWIHIKTHRKTCHNYKDCYKQVLMGKITPADNLMQNFEKELDIFNITLVRKQADFEFERSGLKKAESKSNGWFGGWFGKKKDKKEETSLVKQFEDAMSPEEKAKLCDAIGYSENMTPAVYPKTFIEHKIHLHLKKLRITIVDDSKPIQTDVLHLKLVDVKSAVEQRPSANAVKINATVGTLTVTGFRPDAKGSLPTLVTTKTAEKETKALLLNVLFETAPLDGTCDQRLHVTSNPLEIIFHADTVNTITTFFKPPKNVEIYSKFQAAAASTFDDIRDYSATSYQYAIDQHKYLDLKLDMKGPYLIVPENGVYQKNVPLLLIDMGNLKMHSIKRSESAEGITSLSKLSKQGASQEEIMKEMIAQIYDKYVLSLSGIQVLFASMGDDWMNARTKLKTSLHIWQPTNIEVQLEKSVIMDDPRLPKIKVRGSLPYLHFNLSDQKVLRLAKLLFSIPQPPSEPLTDDILAALDQKIAAEEAKKTLIESNRKLSIDNKNVKALKKLAHKEEAEVKSEEIQSTNVEFTFELGEVSLVISRLKDDREIDFMKFSVNNLGVGMKARTFDTVIDVYLGAIEVVNTQFKSLDSDSPIYIIQTPKSAKTTDIRLCTVQLQMADKKSPIFASHYNRIVQQIVVNFTELKVVLHQEAILDSVKFAKDLVGELEKVQPPQIASPSTLPRTRSDSIRSDRSTRSTVTSMVDKSLKSSSRKLSKRKEEDIELKFVAQLNTVNVSICSNARKVLDLHVGGVKAEVVIQKSMTSVYNVLGNILVLDPTPGAIHSRILSVIGKEVIDTRIVVYNSATVGDNYVDMAKCDTSVVAKLGKVRIFFINKVVTDIMNFASNFQVAIDKVKESAAKAAEVAIENVQSAYEKASRISLSVNMKAPEIVMPRHSKSLEVLLLDMGQLSLQNKFSLGKTTLTQYPTSPILESLTIKLQDFKTSRALWDNKAAKLKAECMLLKPITIGLDIKRNLSASWCVDIPQIDINGKLGMVIATVSQEDYSFVMNTLNENLSEEPITDLREIDITMLDLAVAEPIHKEFVINAKRELSVVIEESSPVPSIHTVHTSFKFYFALDKLSATLYSGSSNLTEGVVNRNSLQALAKFELHVVAVKGEIFSDQSICANVVLVNCILDDIRESQKSFITRLMERTSVDSHNMVDVTFKKDSTADIFLDVKVYSFSLIACPDYLMMISQFFTIDNPKSKETKHKEIKGIKITKSNVNQAIEEPKPEPLKFSTTVKIHVEKPDIILLDDITNINTYGVMLNMEASLRLKMSPERQTMSGAIDDLQILSCCFNPEYRADTTAEILSPCSVSLSSSIPFGEGMHVDLDIGDIELHLTPASVRLLSSIMSKFAVPPPSDELIGAAEEDYSNLWQIKRDNEMDYWFLKPEEGVEVVEDTVVVPTTELEPRNEQMFLRVKTILLTLEIGVGLQTIPMLLLESNCYAEMKNWSKAVEISGGLSLEMLCYNEKLALWEPFIERVETNKSSVRPWELILEMRMNNEPPPAIEQEELDEMSFEIPKSTLLIKSQDVMDLVISKTSLEVLTNLGQSFSDAVNLVTTTKIDAPSAPYVVENYTGFPITLVLSHEDFGVYGKSSKEAITDVVLEPNASVSLCAKMEKGIKEKKSVLRMQEMANDNKLIVKINDMNIVRHMSIRKADKRLFPLPQKTYPGDQWGLVCDVRAVYGSKVVSLRSVVQIRNQFNIPIEVYYMAKEKDELVCCGIAVPNKMFNVPMSAVYTTTNEMFFRPQNDEHKFSVISYTWKDLIKNPTYHRVLECESKQLNGRPFYIHTIGEIDQIFFEDTKKKTLASTCYILNLKPTVLLKNFLPIPLCCNRQGELKDETINSGEKIELFWMDVNSTVLTLQIKDYLNQTWTCSRKLESKVEDLSVWSFESNANTTLKNTLELGIYTENDYSSLTLSLYCPFWMINKTGLPLVYKAEETSITNHPVTHVGPILFSFKAKHFFARKKTCLKIQDTEWSDKFSIDVVGSSGTVKCKHTNGFNYEVGVQIRLSNFKLSKIVIFTPYYLLMNNCKYDVEYCENFATQWMTMPSNQCLPFWPKQTKQSEIMIRIKDCPEVSKPFLYNDQHTTLLPFKNKFGGIQVECQVNESSAILSFASYKKGMASVQIVNSMPNVSITCRQTAEDRTFTIGPCESMFYTWDNPLGKREFLWTPDKKEYKNDLVKDGIGEFKSEKGEGYWVSFLDDTQRTLLFTDDISIATKTQFATEFERIEQEINIHIQGVGVSLVDNINTREVLYISIASSGVVWETCKEKARRFKPLSIEMSSVIEKAYQNYLNAIKTGQPSTPRQMLEHKIEIDFIEGKLYKPNKRKIRRSFQPGCWIMYKTSPHRLQVHAKINRLQIDNQMPDCIFPVILAPIPPSKTVAVDCEPKPFGEVSIMMRKSDFSTIQQYQDVALIQVDQDKENFYDLLHFSPLKVHVSFSNQGSSSTDKKSNPLAANFVSLFVQSVGVTLTEIQDVVFKLAFFERQHKFMSQKQLTGEVITHYCGQAIKQMYVLVLGLDVIGNPFGLVIGLRQGVEDLFYEPIQGAIQGPEEFAEGLALGVKSLFGHAVGGAAGAVSRITGTLGKGIAALTLDDDYQRKRREAQLQRSGNIQEGLAQSGKGLVMGVFDGVTGVFVKPITGAKEEGVEGFFKGVGKGVVGLVTRPTAGVIDFASGTLDSVKRQVTRLRPPRYFQDDKIVRPYNKHEAEGNKLLQDVEKGKFATTDVYVAHAIISTDGKLIVLITDKRIVMVVKGDIFGQWNSDWQLSWEEIKGSPKVTEKGVVIPLREAKKKVLGFFGSGDNVRVINVKNIEVSTWIAEKIEECMATHN